MSALQAEAEGLAHRLAGELYLLAQEEKGRLNAERQDKPRLQAEAELTRRLQAELKEIKHKQVEAEARWHQDAEERRLRVEAEEKQRRDEEEEKRRLETEGDAHPGRTRGDQTPTSRGLKTCLALTRTSIGCRRKQNGGRLEAGLQQMRRQQIEAGALASSRGARLGPKLKNASGEKLRTTSAARKRKTRMIQALENIRRRLSEPQAMQSNLNIDSPPERRRRTRRRRG
jgi:hypothetical protein